MARSSSPCVYQINTRAWLRELSGQLGRPATLDDVPDSTLDHLATLGLDWVWLLGVWQTGPASRRVSRTNPAWLAEYRSVLPDCTEADICGSPFAVRAYAVHAELGGNDALLRMRERLRQRGIRLMLDFVPNHTALDHPWAFDHPEFYVNGRPADRASAPQQWYLVETRHGPQVLAHGRDPYFPAWPDTLQLNYCHRGLQEAMIGELAQIARLCDGVRCDMAMLLLPEVFRRTWGAAAQPADGSLPANESFWTEAIARTRQRQSGFLFLAEAYWDLEWALQQQGFDYTYDKRLYDRLRAQDAAAVRGHLGADLEFQNKSARFVENHDESRAAAAFPPPVHRAAAVLAYLVPGLRLFQEGQWEGWRVRLPVHLCRRPPEPTDAALQDFYWRLLDCLRRPDARGGRWQLLVCRAAWEGNPTWERFIALTRAAERGEPSWLLVTVNYGPTQGQCYVQLPDTGLRGRKFLLRDLLSPASYVREGDDLASRGLYLDVPEWGYHVFEVTAAANS